LSDDDVSAVGHTYRIGTVSRLTGVPADTLRVWERRYGVVAPVRADSGTRLYGSEDVSRLTLIKRLVDRGDAISSVANLSLAQLRERYRGSGLPEPAPVLERPYRVLVAGPSLAERLDREAAQMEGIEVVGRFDAPQAIGRQDQPFPSADLAILEYPTVHADQVREIGELAARCGAMRTVVVYTFASRATLDRLDTRRVTARRAPVDPRELLEWIMRMTPSRALAEESEDVAAVDLSRPIPPRRFADTELIQIEGASPSVRCECPHHLVDLLRSLNAFERYSAECEDRNVDDAALHAYLHAATAHARAVMESALARVVAAEGIMVRPAGGEI
jgi:DNA-binding transcriptional MerR regulator